MWLNSGLADPVLIAVRAELGLEFTLNQIQVFIRLSSEHTTSPDFPQVIHICGNQQVNSRQGIDAKRLSPDLSRLETDNSLAQKSINNATL